MVESDEASAVAESATPLSPSFPPPPAREASPTPVVPSDSESEPAAPPDADADFFEKRDETANEVAEKPLDASLPKHFETDEDDWYVRTGQPAPEREDYDDALQPPISVERSAPAEGDEENPLVVWLPAIAMVAFVLIGVAVVLLVSLAL